MVIDKVNSRLNSLAKLAPQLNKATDLYMDELREIEEKLKKLNLGIEVELNEAIQEGHHFSEDNPNGEPTGITFYSAWMLGYGRIRHSTFTEWSLLVYYYTVYSDDRDWQEEDTFPLLEASRELRIAAAEKIPALLEKIEEAVKGKIETLGKISDKR